MVPARFQYIYFFALFVLVTVLMYFIFRPFIVPLFISIICIVMFGGIHRWIATRMPNRKNIAALCSVAIVLVFIIVPLIIISVLVFNEARDLYASFGQTSTPAGLLNKGLIALQGHIQVYVPQADINLESYVQNGLEWILSNASHFFSSFLKILLDLFIMVVALFYLFRDGKELRQYFVKLSPLEEKDDEDILKKLELTINSVIKGTFVVAILQGALTAIGFALFGIGQPILWGLVAAIASLVPGIGTALVHIPAILFLIVSGHTFEAVGYLAWSFVLTGSIDNVVGPLLVERKVKIHPLLILVSVLGGLVLFGPIGFLAGPVALAFASELVKLYPKFMSSSHA